MLPYTGETIPYTELPPAHPNSPTAAEWETYRRAVGRLVAEGHEGKVALIRSDDIVGLFDSEDEAQKEGLRRFGLQAHLVHVIRSREPLIRAPVWFHLWHASRSRFRPTG
jgi:hypothetical protein